MQLQRKDLQIGGIVVAALVGLVGLWAILRLVGGSDGSPQDAAGNPALASVEDGADDYGTSDNGDGGVLDDVDEPVIIDATPLATGGSATVTSGDDASTSAAAAVGGGASNDDYWDRVFEPRDGASPVVTTRTPEVETVRPLGGLGEGATSVTPEPGTANAAASTDGPAATLASFGSSGPGSPAVTRNDAGQRTYVVERGDSFYTIALEQLGDASLYRAIERANPDVDPRKMRVGTSIVLPEPDAAGEAGSSTPAAGPSAQVFADDARTHVVAKGETLSHIAVKRYGEAWMWRDILAANEALLGGNPEALRPNMLLVIPELPDGALGSD